MPVYEFYCPSCKQTFEKLRPMSSSDAEVRCTDGHAGARRLLSSFAVGGRTAVAEALDFSAAPQAGGCCGMGGCACGQ